MPLLDPSEYEAINPHANPEAAVVLDSPSERIFDHDMEVDDIPEGAVEKGEPFDLPCDLLLKPTEEFVRWAEDCGVTYRFGFHDTENTPQIEVGDEAQAVLVRLNWG